MFQEAIFGENIIHIDLLMVLPIKVLGYPQLHGIDAKPGKYNLLSWDMSPVDCLVFQGMIVHGASGNVSNNRRRAWATRWTGDDARYYKPAGEVVIPTEGPCLDDGDILGSVAFSIIWKANT